MKLINIKTKSAMVKPRLLAVTVLLVLKSHISECNNASTNMMYTSTPDLSKLIISESTLHICKKDLLHNENFYTNCSNVFGGSNDSETKCWIAPPHLISSNNDVEFRLSVKDVPDSCNLNLSLPLLFNNEIIRMDNSFIRNGYLRIEDQFYSTDEYCINSVKGDQMEIKICKTNCGKERLCIRKCCRLDQLYSFGVSPNPNHDPNLQKGCKSAQDGIFRPSIYHDSRVLVSEEQLRNSPGMHFIKSSPATFKRNCPDERTLFFSTPHVAKNIYAANNTLKFEDLRFRMRKDGKILFRGKGGACEILDPHKDEFCIDGAINFGLTNHKYRNSEDEMILFLCVFPPKKEMDPSLAYGSMMLFSCIFLVLTIIVYGMLWERQTVHGWTIVTHTICLCFMYVFVGTGHFLRAFKGAAAHNTAGCVFVGVTAHFFTLATFSWLAVISFDLFLTFRAITPRSGNRSKGCSRYVKYSIFGWGIPIIIIITGLIIDGKHTDDDCLEIIAPGYGDESCYLQENAMGLYLYLPLGVFLVVNLIFFAITTTKLYQFRESTKMATKDDTQQQFYRLFVKLFFVMGILWIFEVISWAVSGMGMHWYWVIFDVINILRAVAVFFIFVCKPDIINSLEQKYPRLRPLFVPCKRIIFRKGRHSSQKSHTTDESMVLNSSIRTKSSFVRSTDMDN